MPLECLPEHRGTLTLHCAGARPSQPSSLARTMEKAVLNSSRARSPGPEIQGSWVASCMHSPSCLLNGDGNAQCFWRAGKCNPVDEGAC